MSNFGSCHDSDCRIQYNLIGLKFENEISKLTGAKYVVATNSGTSALHVSCILMNVQENTEVLVPSFTFVGTANAVKYCGAIPHFVDIEEEHFGINVEKLEIYLKINSLFKPLNRSKK